MLSFVPGVLVTIVKLCFWLTLLSALFVPLERLFAARRQAVFRKQTGIDLGYFFLSGVLPSLLLSTPLAVLAWAAHAAVPTGLTAAIAQWPIWLRVVAALVVGEIGFYWGHRWSHQVPLLWQFHAIHHSAEQIDWLVNTRAHPIDMIFTRLCGLVPLYVLGLAAPMAGSASLIPVIVLLAGIVWGFFVHANLRWRFGVLEWLVATPAFHHWHHTNDGPEVVDKNYAAMLPWVDRLFGTFHLPKDRLPVRYGTDHPMPPKLVDQLLQPFMPDVTGAQIAPREGETK
jgi:sterol desaturase/sphingolipid hydroxylase (fatty acid hydroxylase superfamily)